MAHSVTVDYVHVALGEGADPVLRVARGADLAHHQHVKRRPERLRDLVCDRHPAPCQADHHRLLARQRAQTLGQLPAGGVPVGEPVVSDHRLDHHSLLE